MRTLALCLLATLSASWTAPALRNAGDDCDAPALIPASAQSVTIDASWMCWSCVPFWPTVGFKRFRVTPGERVTLLRVVVPGDYDLHIHPASAAGIPACADTMISVRAR